LADSPRARSHGSLDRAPIVAKEEAVTENLAISPNHFKTGIFMAFLLAPLAIGGAAWWNAGNGAGGRLRPRDELRGVLVFRLHRVAVRA
jgi:hypothetical protein